MRQRRKFSFDSKIIIIKILPYASLVLDNSKSNPTLNQLSTIINFKLNFSIKEIKGLKK